LIGTENAIAHADSKNDLRLMIKMYSDQQTGDKQARIDKTQYRG